METITIGKLTLTVAAPPAEETIINLASANKWTISRFKDNGQWTFEPVTNSTRIPAEGLRRKRMVEETGVEVQWIVAHEIEREIEPPKTLMNDDLAVKVVLGIFGAVVAIKLLPVVGLVALASLVGYDPILIAKINDSKGEEVWIELFRWLSKG